MSNQKRDYDSTVARIAGNIAPALIRMDGFRLPNGNADGNAVARMAVALARAIVAEVKRTEPKEPQP